MSNVTIASFDTRDDSSGANLAVISDVIEDCPVPEWVHASGGLKLRNVTADPVLAGSLDPEIQAGPTEK